MRILILSFYYPPDLSAGSFRASALVSALRERAPAGTQLEVVTTLPNRYRTYSQAAPLTETSEGLEIRRIPMPAHESDMVGQSRAFLRFARQALRHTARRPYDVVLATSSRLMTATLGAWIARRKHARLYLDIRDIFVDTMGDLLPPPAAWPVRWIFSRVESWTMRRADRINLVSAGFEEYFRARYGDRSLAWFTNGVDDEFLACVPRPAVRPSRDQRATVLYAGNIGAGQDLHEILPGLARALRDRARFIVVGDGGRRAALEAAVAGEDTVEIRAPMPRSPAPRVISGRGRPVSAPWS
jgi:glycosyltransferase involved in cell wall biosynthesis